MTLPYWARDDGKTRYHVVTEDGDRVLLRGVGAIAGSSSFLVAGPSDGHSTREFGARLTNEHSLRPHLENSWAARPARLVDTYAVTTLVLDDPGGDCLKRMIGAPVDIRSFLRLGIAISDAVASAHEAGLLHKDIKPSNILVAASGDHAWLTGFGIASRLPRERQAPAPPEVIAGTFAYMAPEQTGRMNRSIDTRSDLYALGVTLYETLTGVLPFAASDPMEWIHCHIARQPASPSDGRPGIPAQLSAIIMKLLAKAAEDRYRSAVGLRSDLRRCLAEWEVHGEIPPFDLGATEAPDQLIFHEKLYGREQEINRLDAAFERVVTTGVPGLVLVSGYSGIGKSSVVNELHKSLVPARGLFAVGKFDQYKRDIPYATLAQAFQGLVRQLLSKSDAELAQWRTALSQALGFNGRLMVNLIPELAHVIGEPPPVPDLSGPEAQKRFRLVFRQLIGVFARPEHPLVLFLDDLQWLDAATLDIFESLTDETELGSLLLVGAYRDNEVGPDHPLSARLEAIRRSGIPIEEIVLRGVDVEDVGRMIADALEAQSESVNPLSGIVFVKTGGNPFFTTQFVTSLVDENLLYYDSSAARWRWDIDRIGAKYVSGSVVDLMVERLSRLSDRSQQALKQLAGIGSNVKIVTFQRMSDVAGNDTQTLLQDAFRAGLLFQTEDAYSFAHDRVHEAAYSTIPESERGATHWAIGSRLVSTLDEDEIEANIFDIVSQFNRGETSDASQPEIAAVASLNLRAGRRAKASAAYAAACGYVAKGLAQLGEIGWKSDYDLAFALALELAECNFRSGDIDESERMIEALLLRQTTDVDRAAIYRIKVELCVVKSDNSGAVENAIEGLKLLGIDLPRRPSWDDVQREYDAILENLQGRPIETFADLPPTTDLKALAAMRLLAEMQPPAYFSNFNMTILVICRMINLCLERGTASTSAQGLVLLGYAIGPAFGRYEDGYRIAKLAGRLAAERNVAVDIARVNHLTGLAAAWTEPLPTALDWLRSAFRGGVEAGDLYYACFEAAVIVLHVFLSGQNLKDVDAECAQALEFARKTGFRAGMDLVIATERAAASLSGRTRALASYDADDFDEAAFEANLTTTQNSVVMWWYWTRKTMTHVLAGQYENALAAAAKVRSNPSIRNMQIEQMDYHYFSALATAALIEKSPDAEREAMSAEIAKHHAQLNIWAQEARSPSFDDKHVLVAAEIARLEGHGADAQRLYDESIRIARTNGFVQYEAIANETAARFHAGRGSENLARSYRAEARVCYARWGASAKVRQLDEMYPDLREDQPLMHSTSTTLSGVEQLDLATVIKVAQTVSGEIVLEKLVDTLMRTTIEHAGAGRAVLILSGGAGYAVEAEALMTGKGVVVRQRQDFETAIGLPEAVTQYVIRTKETVILDNALADHRFSVDPYIRQHRVRSLLVLPLVNQGKLLGLLHLENNLAANVFTQNRLSILKLIASHAAIALENTRLYRDLEEREARIRRLVDANIIGVFMWTLDGEIFEANDSFLEMVGFDREDLAAGQLKWTDLSPPEGWASDARKAEEVKTTGIASPWEKEFLRKDGSRVPVLIGAAAFGETEFESGVSYVLDLTARKRAEDSARASDHRNRELQSELAHANRVAIAGQLSAAISHDVMQPLVGVVTSGTAGLNWLAADPPKIGAARRAFERVVSEGHRAAEVLERTRALVKKSPPKTEVIDINAIITDTASLINAEALKKGVSLRIQLGDTLPPVAADRVQVQQVILNLSVNAIEAMAAETNSAGRELTIISAEQGEDGITVSVHDTGPGIPQEVRNKVFDAFYSTKAHGMGMGLAISKSIAASHGGKLWATANEPTGAIFWFSLPAGAN
ncbi:AAA family ATPase [Ferirhizobium litorale]|uniref:histidine kinase n=1 Tax=Ferirhizobium litorale TaxID=2927786 RepID=A0AAE3QG61_9HYPH|nr:AAA family ATPase [Fererhizobium litorale]MDI7925202.1 AAA family ATPase [Fererhizobium litorale]